jgi:hypothetical protein
VEYGEADLFVEFEEKPVGKRIGSNGGERARPDPAFWVLDWDSKAIQDRLDSRVMVSSRR